MLNEETVHMEAGIDGHQFARQTHTPVVGVIFDLLVVIVFLEAQRLDAEKGEEQGDRRGDNPRRQPGGSAERCGDGQDQGRLLARIYSEADLLVGARVEGLEAAS